VFVIAIIAQHYQSVETSDDLISGFQFRYDIDTILKNIAISISISIF